VVFLFESLVLVIIIRILTMPSSCESNSTIERRRPPLPLVDHLLLRSEEPSAWTPRISQRGSAHSLEHIICLVDEALQIVSDGDDTRLVLLVDEEGGGQEEDSGTSTRASSEDGPVKRGVPKQ
jgi:hypothetical protein